MIYIASTKDGPLKASTDKVALEKRVKEKRKEEKEYTKKNAEFSSNPKYKQVLKPFINLPIKNYVRSYEKWSSSDAQHDFQLYRRRHSFIGEDKELIDKYSEYKVFKRIKITECEEL